MHFYLIMHVCLDLCLYFSWVPLCDKSCWVFISILIFQDTQNVGFFCNVWKTWQRNIQEQNLWRSYLLTAYLTIQIEIFPLFWSTITVLSRGIMWDCIVLVAGVLQKVYLKFASSQFFFCWTFGPFKCGIKLLLLLVPRGYAPMICVLQKHHELQFQIFASVYVHISFLICFLSMVPVRRGVTCE